MHFAADIVSSNTLHGALVSLMESTAHTISDLEQQACDAVCLDVQAPSSALAAHAGIPRCVW